MPYADADHLSTSRSERSYFADSDPARNRLIRRVAFRLAAGTVGLLTLFGITIAVLSRLVGPALVVAASVFVAVSTAWWVARWGANELGRLFSHEDRLVRSLAHEIRHPLHRLFIVADFGLEGMISTEQALKEAVEHAENLSLLLDDLFEVAQVISGSKTLSTEQVEVEPLVDEALKRLGDSRLSVEVEGGPGLLVANPRLIRLAITNLLRNASSHGYRGRGGAVLLTIEPAGFRVRDWGEGIEPVQLMKIEHALKQSLRRSGAGVGLSLTAWVVDIHGGRLRIENQPDGGVEVSLSVADAAEPTARRSEET